MQPEPSQQAVDDLRGVIDRACEAVAKGDAPASIAAYIWSNVGPRLAEYEGEIERLEKYGCAHGSVHAKGCAYCDCHIEFLKQRTEAIKLKDRADKAEAEVEELEAEIAAGLEAAVLDGRREACESLAEEFERRADLPAHQDVMQLRSGILLDAAALCRQEAAEGKPEQGIPHDYWREVPCGHPPDPVAMYGRDGEPVCHCGCILDQQDGIDVDGAPGPIVHCSKCGCHVAVPPRLAAQPQEGEKR